MSKLKIMSIFGTRPEAIKMAPLVKAIANTPNMESIVTVTAQHREMLDQVLDLFDIKPHYDLNIMKAGQSLYDITARVLKGLEEILEREKPHLVLVHGDTSTTFAASLAAYYKQIPVGHVEAGLRSGNIYSPFPEEMNRKLTGNIASLHFAPTERAAENLKKEGVRDENIFITGNTVIDALLQTVKENYNFTSEKLQKIDFTHKKVLLVTTHRRENLGKPMEGFFKSLLKVYREFPNIEIIFPVHKNPQVRELANKILDGYEGIHLIEPLDYEPFTQVLNKCYLVLTDSGGLQEEAPSLGKPVLVLRENTERPEAVVAGTVKLIGTSEENVYKYTKELLTNEDLYVKMKKTTNPYGDGRASERIIKALNNFFE